ncbi:hypothetical protein BKA62DRAFT_343484 [Auriculariales sp. MPI-PUGE-AT-0066]|nr:hypothetical protein BKA62DRAFT_343484 [Auriculariales sp. MPI-PUGE-AT-0066]
MRCKSQPARASRTYIDAVAMSLPIALVLLLAIVPLAQAVPVRALPGQLGARSSCSSQARSQSATTQHTFDPERRLDSRLFSSRLPRALLDIELGGQRARPAQVVPVQKVQVNSANASAKHAPQNYVVTGLNNVKYASANPASSPTVVYSSRPHSLLDLNLRRDEDSDDADEVDDSEKRSLIDVDVGSQPPKSVAPVADDFNTSPQSFDDDDDDAHVQLNQHGQQRGKGKNGKGRNGKNGGKKGNGQHRGQGARPQSFDGVNGHFAVARPQSFDSGSEIVDAAAAAAPTAVTVPAQSHGLLGLNLKRGIGSLLDVDVGGSYDPVTFVQPVATVASVVTPAASVTPLARPVESLAASAHPVAVHSNETSHRAHVEPPVSMITSNMQPVVQAASAANATPASGATTYVLEEVHPHPLVDVDIGLKRDISEHEERRSLLDLNIGAHPEAVAYVVPAQAQPLNNVYSRPPIQAAHVQARPSAQTAAHIQARPPIQAAHVQAQPSVQAAASVRPVVASGPTYIYNAAPRPLIDLQLRQDDEDNDSVELSSRHTDKDTDDDEDARADGTAHKHHHEHTHESRNIDASGQLEERGEHIHKHIHEDKHSHNEHVHKHVHKHSHREFADEPEVETRGDGVNAAEPHVEERGEKHHHHHHHHHHHDHDKREVVEERGEHKHVHEHIHEDKHDKHRHEHIHSHRDIKVSADEDEVIAPLFQASGKSMHFVGVKSSPKPKQKHQHHDKDKHHKRDEADAPAPDAPLSPACPDLSSAVKGVLQLVSPDASDPSTAPETVANLFLATGEHAKDELVMNASNDTKTDVFLIALGAPSKDGTIRSNFVVHMLDEDAGKMTCLCASFDATKVSPLSLLPCNTDLSSSVLSQTFLFDTATGFVSPQWRKTAEAAGFKTVSRRQAVVDSLAGSGPASGVINTVTSNLRAVKSTVDEKLYEHDIDSSDEITRDVTREGVHVINAARPVPTSTVHNVASPSSMLPEPAADGKKQVLLAFKPATDVVSPPWRAARAKATDTASSAHSQATNSAEAMSDLLPQQTSATEEPADPTSTSEESTATPTEEPAQTAQPNSNEDDSYMVTSPPVQETTEPAAEQTAARSTSTRTGLSKVQNMVASTALASPVPLSS